MQRLGVEVAGAAGDDGLGDLNHFRRDFAFRPLDEFGGDEFLGCAQRRHHQPGAVRLDQRRPFLIADADMAERDPLAAPHREAQGMHRIRRQLAFRMDVVRRFEIELVDLVARHEMVEIDDVPGFAAECLQLVLTHHDVARLLEFVAFDERVGRDDIAALGVDELLGHRIAGPRTQHVELDPLAIACRGCQTDRARHQRHAQEPVPYRFNHRLFLPLATDARNLIARNLEASAPCASCLTSGRGQLSPVDRVAEFQPGARFRHRIFEAGGAIEQDRALAGVDPTVGQGLPVGGEGRRAFGA